MKAREYTREYYENRRNEAWDLFLHFSFIRMTILAFMLPLAAVIMTGAQERVWVEGAGGLLAFLAWILNLGFGSQALGMALRYQNLARWLRDKTAATIAEEPPSLKVGLIEYLRVLIFKNPLADVPVATAWARMEPLIQLAVMVGTGVFALLFFGLDEWM